MNLLIACPKFMILSKVRMSNKSFWWLDTTVSTCTLAYSSVLGWKWNVRPGIAKLMETSNVWTLVIPYAITSEQAVNPTMSSSRYRSLFAISPILLGLIEDSEGCQMTNCYCGYCCCVLHPHLFKVFPSIVLKILSHSFLITITFVYMSVHLGNTS